MDEDEEGERVGEDMGEAVEMGELGRESGPTLRTGSGGGRSDVEVWIWMRSVSIWEGGVRKALYTPQVIQLTRLTMRLRRPRNTSPRSTQRFHAQSAPWKRPYDTTAIQRYGFDSSNDIL